MTKQYFFFNPVEHLILDPYKILQMACFYSFGFAGFLIPGPELLNSTMEIVYEGILTHSQSIDPHATSIISPQGPLSCFSGACDGYKGLF